MTQAQEQAQLAEALCRAAPVVPPRNKLLITTPATNLIRMIPPYGVLGGDRFAAFANHNFVGNIARCSEIYEKP